MENVESGEVVEEESTDTVSSTVMERVTVRLPPKTIAMFDTAVENGLAASRSDGIRMILGVFEDMSGAYSRVVVPLVFHLLTEPIELILWLQQRLALMGHDDQWRRRYAGHVASLVKAMDKGTGMLDQTAVPLVRDEVLRVLDSFNPLEVSPDGETVPQTAPAKDRLLAGVLWDLISELSDRIQSGAEATEVTDKLLGMIHLAALHHYYGAEGLPHSLCAMADAADIQSTLLGAEGQAKGQKDLSGFVGAYEDFCLLVPPLYDDRSLKHTVGNKLRNGLSIPPFPFVPREEVAEDEKTETEQQEV